MTAISAIFGDKQMLGPSVLQTPALVSKTLRENTIYQILMWLTTVLQNYILTSVLPANRMLQFCT